ncbi:hypothetical protein LTR85_001042 [Meristemomyces frigidus]|nr:hypothetical protein LTR85_001042 [Meristemomyces frigidus]
MAATEQTACAACGKPASTRCAGCIEGLDQNGQLSLTYYCNKDCQRAHWPKHKNDCKLANARKVLYRGGEFLMTVWMAFREEAFDLCLGQAHKEGEELHVFEGKWNGPQVLVRYQQHLASDPLDKEALLSHRACTDAVANIHGLILKIFAGIPKFVIVEAMVKMPQGSGKVIFHQASGSIDYGQHRAVMPCDEYCSLTSSSFIKAYEIGSGMRRYEGRYAGVVSPTPGEMVPAVHTEIRKCVEQAVRNWEQRSGQSLA